MWALWDVNFFAILLAAFWTVFVAELVGDKSIYTVASLALRYRAGIVAAGMSAASACKMLVAVLLARVFFHIQSTWAGVISAIAFFVSAMFLWFKEPEVSRKELAINANTWSAGLVCFASLFVTEWGDPSQIAVAALTAKSHAWVAPWLGGTLAMTLKGILALTLGMRLGDWFPPRTLRVLAATSCCVLGLLTLSGSVLH